MHSAVVVVASADLLTVVGDVDIVVDDPVIDYVAEFVLPRSVGVVPDLVVSAL